MGVEWGGGALRRPLLRATRAVRRCTWGCCCDELDRKYLRHMEEREVSRMLDDYLDDPYEDLREQAIDGAYYDALNDALWNTPVREGELTYEVDYDADERRGGDDQHTYEARNGFRWDVV